MKKLLIVVLLLILGGSILLNCTDEEPEQNAKITGRVNFAIPGEITLSVFASGNELVTLDTIDLVNNLYFTFDVQVDTSNYYQLNFFNKQRLNLILYPGSDMQIEVDGNSSFGEAAILGSKDHTMLDSIGDIKAELNTKINNIATPRRLYDLRVKNDSLQLDSLMQLRRIERSNFQERVRKYLRTNELNIGFIQACSILEGAENKGFRDSVANELIKKFPNSIQAREFAKGS